MFSEELLTYPPCCERQDLVPIGGNIVKCQTCSEVLSPYARVQHKIYELEAAPGLSDEQTIRMRRRLDQVAAALEDARQGRITNREALHRAGLELP